MDSAAPDSRKVMAILAELDERHRSALLYDPTAANHRDGMVMTKLRILGLCSFSRSGDNACPLTPLGEAVRDLLAFVQAEAKRMAPPPSNDTEGLGSTDVADALDRAETSLELYCDLGWHGKLAFDARDALRLIDGVFKSIREDLCLRPYARPEYAPEREQALRAVPSHGRLKQLEDALLPIAETATPLDDHRACDTMPLADHPAGRALTLGDLRAIIALRSTDLNKASTS